MKSEIRIPFKSEKAAILLPGVSGKSLTDKKYDLLEERLKQNNIALIRFDLWNNRDELSLLSVEEIQKEVMNIIKKLKSQNFKNISIIGKSLGGATALTMPYNFDKIIAWAPAFSYQKQSNFLKTKSSKLSNFKSTGEITINRSDLAHLKCPILIIHGENDEKVSLENSENYLINLKNAKLEIINGADHSYTQDIWLDEVINKTVEFLKNN
jgi:hypothetical protein